MNEDYDIEEWAPWMVVAITLAAGFLRMILIGARGMWLDETFSVWMASQSIGDMLGWLVRIDQHPPLYYLLLHYWIALNGDTAYYVRMLSALFGAATIPFVYLIGKRISGAVMGLAAAALLALSLFNIYYGQEARMYTLLTFNATVATYALVRLLTDPRAARPIGSQVLDWLRAWRSGEPAATETAEALYGNEASPGRRPPIEAIETDLAWAAFVIFSVATLLSHNTAILFPAAVNVFVLGLMAYQRVRRPGPPPAFEAPSFGNWTKAQIAILVLWSPWLPFFIQQAGAVDQRFWIPKPTWEIVLKTVQTFLNPSAPLPAGQAAAIWIFYGVMLCLGLVYFRKRPAQLLFLAALFAVPFLGELLVSLRRPIFFDRTLIWTTIPLYLTLAAGVAVLKRRPLMILALGVLGAINLFSAGDYYRFYQKEDWATAAGYVAQFAQKDDLVLFNSNMTVIPFNYYFREYEKLYSIQVQKRGVPQDLVADGVLEPEMTAKDVPGFVSLLEGHKRVWLVYSHDSFTDPQGLIPETLAAQMTLARTRDFNGGRVQLYERP